MKQANPWALLPFAIFLALFAGAGLVTGDFTKFPVLVAVLIASGVAFLMNRSLSLNEKTALFCRGAGHDNIILMVIIFLLSGAFSAVAKGMGAVDATVNLALSILPQNLLIVGMFVIACFISLSMGTSMGTIVALAPIGVGISGQTDIPVALAIAAVIGGAMFGDNLSVISDTTIAAVNSQNINMKDKFKVNFFIVLPAALVTVAILTFLTLGGQSHVTTDQVAWVKTLPYLAVLIAALAGVNVLLVLPGGIVFAGAIGLMDGSYTVMSFIKEIGNGFAGMQELSILVLLIGGMVELIRHYGGIDFLLQAITRNIRSKKGAEFGIAGLVSATNLAIANNTISIIIAGPLAKEIAERYEIDRRKSASLLDIFSCCIQGLIPYGPQLLVAAGVASISPLSILQYNVYPLLIGVCAAISILIGYPRAKEAQPAVQKTTLPANQ
ncbi:putative methionine transporter (NhaC family) [Laceyella sediminis]|jgi:Na+/H+ antiporter NhaC|uniref:Methionine transporter (NhaC family) n=1 Tax=Laceyella sediminis TaxID=573074 RepID=A0ABX5EK98_9BACL|nr:Na+/H+ antiporter NhaC family protein [Laceyella sediminis]PRZ12244.1 putative methionine transporter (NhaC family) [Laceyella sediminis]